MFSIGDTVYSTDIQQEGVVEKVDTDCITVRFKELSVPIGIPRERLTLIKKTTSQRELNATLDKNKKSSVFSIDCNQDKLFSEASLSLSKFVEKLNNYRNQWTKELSFSWVNNLLVKNGYLTTNEYGSTVPTEKGKLLGISRRRFYINRFEMRYGNFYDLCAQEMVLKLILDNLKEPSKKFKIEITKVLQKTIEVEANSEKEAIEMVRKMYNDEEIVLDDSNYIDTKIDIIK